MAAAKICGLAHIGLFITDIERTKAFYKDILEFDNIYECQSKEADGSITKICFMRNGDLTLELVQFEKPTQKVDGWVDHIALKVQNIEATKELLESRGIEFEEKEITYAPHVFPNGDKWILFRGPDGEHLEINEIQ